MNEIRRIYQQNPLQAITLTISVIASCLATLIALAVWQSTLTKRVDAVETTVTTQQSTLNLILEKVNTIDARGQINTQRVDDTNSTVALIYSILKDK